MSREGPYIPIDTKINFIGGRFGKSREGVATTPLVGRVTKNNLVRRGLMFIRRKHMLVHEKLMGRSRLILRISRAGWPVLRKFID